MQNVDVAIVGGGMVGLALACGLQGSGLRGRAGAKAAPACRIRCPAGTPRVGD